MLSLVLSAFSFSGPTPSPSPPTPSLPPVGPGSLTFLAVGDWGEDNEGQYADAKGMETIAEQIRPSFMLMLGDNFYSSGIHGDAHAERFEKTFEVRARAPPLHCLALDLSRRRSPRRTCTLARRSTT